MSDEGRPGWPAAASELCESDAHSVPVPPIFAALLRTYP
jgi:hypothetical protein